jgi:hypothetical protein
VRTLVTQEKIGQSVYAKHDWKQVPKFRRLLIVRNPLDRWTSTYWWIKGTGTYQGYAPKINPYMEDFENFTRFITEKRSSSFVFQSLDKYVKQFCPDEIIPLENLGADWSRWFPKSVQETYAKACPHATRHRLSTALTAKFPLPRDFESLIQREVSSLGDLYSTNEKCPHD